MHDVCILYPPYIYDQQVFLARLTLFDSIKGDSFIIYTYVYQPHIIAQI